MKIRIHQLVHNVNVVEILPSWRANDVCNGNDLLQVKEVVNNIRQETGVHTDVADDQDNRQ